MRQQAPPRHSVGFTLLELMVVLVIIGILFGYAVISLKQGDQQARAREEARRVNAYILAAQEEAILKHRELALRFERDRYSFLQLDNGQWKPLEGDEVFKPYKLPNNMHCYVEVKDGSIPLSGDGRVSEAMVLILSSGEISPFELHIEAVDGSSHALRMDFMGGSELYQPGQA